MYTLLLFLLFAFATADDSTPDPDNDHPDPRPLDFFTFTKSVDLFESSKLEHICLTTGSIDTTKENWNARISAIKNDITAIKENAVVKELKAGPLMAHALDYLFNTDFALDQLNSDVLSMFEIGVDGNFSAPFCNHSLTVPSPPIYANLAFLKQDIGLMKTTAAKETTSSSDDAKTKLTNEMYVDTRVSFLYLTDTYDELRLMYSITEMLLNGQISDFLYNFLNEKVPGYKGTQERTKVDHCVKIGTGLKCLIEITKLENVGEGYYFTGVPFEFENEIYVMTLPGYFMDNTGTFLAHACTPYQNGEGCVDVEFATSACLNAINSGDFPSIGQNCDFEIVYQDSHFVKHTLQGGLVIGPAKKENLVVFVNGRNRVLEFPTYICDLGQVSISQGDFHTDFSIACAPPVVSTFLYNETVLGIIFSNTNSWAKTLENILPEDMEDVILIGSLLLQLLSLPFLVTVCCTCCNKNCKKGGRLDFVGKYRRYRRVPTAPPAPSKSERIEMKAKNFVKAEATCSPARKM